MAPRWPVSLIAPSTLAAGAVIWRMGPVHRLTVVAKATFGLVHEGTARLLPPVDLVVEDRGPPTGALEEASELAPFLPTAGVVLAAHAYAPAGRPAPGMVVRLALVRDQRTLLDKTLHVFGYRPPGGNAAALPFQKIPLTWDRAFGGPGVEDNPVGAGAAGTLARPNVLDPLDPQRPAGFGPIARSWGPRRRLLGAADPGGLLRAAPELPEGFDFRWYHAAPADQQVELLHGGEWIILEGMHPALAALHTRLPSARAAARVVHPRGPVQPIDLVADTLAIDADFQICSLVWRGHRVIDAALAEALPHLRVQLGLEMPGHPIVWPEAPEPAGGLPPIPTPSVLPPVASPSAPRAPTAGHAVRRTIVLAQSPYAGFGLPPQPPPAPSVEPAAVTSLVEPEVHEAQTRGVVVARPSRPPLPFQPTPADPRHAAGPDPDEATRGFPLPAPPRAPPSAPYAACPDDEATRGFPLPAPPRAAPSAPYATSLGAPAVSDLGAPAAHADGPDLDGHTRGMLAVSLPRPALPFQPVDGPRAPGPRTRQADGALPFRAPDAPPSAPSASHAPQAALPPSRAGRDADAGELRAARGGPPPARRAEPLWGPQDDDEKTSVVDLDAIGARPIAPFAVAPPATHAGAPVPLPGAPWGPKAEPVPEVEGEHMATISQVLPGAARLRDLELPPTGQAGLELVADEDVVDAEDDEEPKTLPPPPPAVAPPPVHLSPPPIFSLPLMASLSIDAPSPVGPRPTTNAELDVGLTERTPVSTAGGAQLESPGAGASPATPPPPPLVAPPALVVPPPLVVPPALVAPAPSSSAPAPAPGPPLPSAPPPSAPSVITSSSPLRERVLAALASGQGLHDLDLKGADLSGLAFRRAVLGGVKLAGAVLRGCCFAEARLGDADLAGADLEGADLSGAQLARADLSRASLVNARLDGATLDDANLQGARGVGARLGGAFARRATFARGTWEGAVFDGLSAPSADFGEAALGGASFRGADLVEVRLEGAHGQRVTFDGARMPDARAEGASLTQSSFVGVDARGSIWEQATLDDSRFDEADLEDASLLGVACVRARFVGARAAKANMERLGGDGANLSGAKLSGANLRGARLPEADLQGAELRGVAANRVDLSRARLVRADLGGAILRAGKLTGAVLAHSVLEGADLRDADLERANLFGAQRKTAKMSGANLKDVVEVDPEA